MALDEAEDLGPLGACGESGRGRNPVDEVPAEAVILVSSVKLHALADPVVPSRSRQMGRRVGVQEDECSRIGSHMCISTGEARLSGLGPVAPVISLEILHKGKELGLGSQLVGVDACTAADRVPS